MAQGRDSLFRRFTEQAREVVVLAQSEARASGFPYIGDIHILIGIAQAEGLGGQILESSGLTLDRVRAKMASLDGAEKGSPNDQIPFTPRAKKVFELALREALSLGHNYIGTEHLLLGLAREEESVSAELLAGVDLELSQVRKEVLEALSRSKPHVFEESRAATKKDAERAGDSPSESDEGIEAVPTHPDTPATRDELGRARLAEVLGERLRRVRGEDTEAEIDTWWKRRRKRQKDTAAGRRVGSFMVHIHAPWGAGKSSLLNFLGADLRNRHSPKGKLGALLHRSKTTDPRLSRWVVVEFSAWEHQRLSPPWWWLLAAIHRSCAKELWQINRFQWAWFLVRDAAWRAWNARAALLTLLILGSLLVTALLTDWFGLGGKPLTTVQAVIATTLAAVGLTTTVFGLARGASRWLAIGSAEGAVRFLKRAHDPLGVYQRRFRWLVKSSSYPIAVFIDDLDRCKPGYVVELLEGIQTLFTNEPITYVIAADRTWLCESFAQTYSEFEHSVGEPGRPLGFLFLEKTFQISMEIPPMSNRDQERYWDGLMRREENEDGRGVDVSPKVMEALASASTQAEIESKVGALLSAGESDEKVLSAAVRRLNAPDMQDHLEKLLNEFAPLLENNPRSMKRLMNAYGIERDRLLRHGYLLTREERRQLALLTILRLRWPVLAEHLQRSPQDAEFCLTGRSPAPPHHPHAELFEDEEVRRLFDGSHIEEKLDPQMLATFPIRPVTEDD